MKKTISLFLIFAFIAISINLFGQEKWSFDSRKVGIVGIGKPSNPGFIMPNYINPNTTPRILQSPFGINLINANIRVHPNNTNYQSETYLTRSPANALIMFGAANTYTVGQSGSFLYSTGYYITTNGGANWYGNDTLNSNYGDPGPILDKNGVMIMTYLGNPSGMGAARSTNNGLTWQPGVTINTSSVDKNLANTDEAPSSAYYGRSYVVWSDFAQAAPNIVFSFTTNSGVSWSAPASINTPIASHYSQGCDIVVNTTGTVYVTWANPILGSPYTETSFGFAKSTNGGASWTVTDPVFAGNGIRGTFPTKNSLRVNSFPRIDVDKSGGSRNGWIYIVTSQKSLAPAGSDPDIVLHSSSDGGATWTAGVRVNQDPINNGKFQWFPVVKVDEFGGVNVAYYDDRNVLADSAEVYVSRSIDGGVTWVDNLVSDARSKIVPISESGIATGYGGDYIGMACANNKVWPFWMDRRTGLWQVFTTSIDLGPGINHTPLTNTEQTTGTRAVNAVITPAGSPIDPTKTKLVFGKGGIYTDSLLMTNSSGNNWTANLTLSGAGIYKYYIKTADNLGRIATSPSGAPGNFYSFTAAPDTVHPVITHTPFGPTPKSYWPLTVTAGATDNIGVDSVWVMWYKNTPTTIKEFKLIHGGGTSYSAVFNSINSDVNVGDVIYYKVMADDISSNHNVTSLPTSGYFSFGIVNLRLCEGFNSATFPPTNWSIVGAGATDWLYSPVSGFGNGTGSARFNFYNALAGVTASLVSLQFDPSAPGDSLRFDLADAYYNATSIDTMAIETSTNGGTTFINLWTLWSQTSFTDPHSLSTVSQLGIFTPTSSQWKVMKYALPTGTNQIRFRCNSGYGNDMFIDSICQISGPTGIGNNTTIPLVYSLSQNYPNPFNPVTQIKFAIPKQGFVTVKVYDLLGREITRLVNDVKLPGEYSVDFDGTNIASGVYFYKLDVNGFSDVKKMLLIK